MSCSFLPLSARGSGFLTDHVSSHPVCTSRHSERLLDVSVVAMRQDLMRKRERNCEQSGVHYCKRSETTVEMPYCSVIVDGRWKGLCRGQAIL
jgi:hypothetical protein